MTRSEIIKVDYRELNEAAEADDNCIRRELEETPYDHTFIVDNRDEMCHATGYEVLIHGIWWNEYIDSLGDYHYGN